MDFADPTDDLGRYRLVVVPALYLLSDEAATALTRYVNGGGHLVVSYLSGIADPFHRVRVGGYPGALRDLLGVRVEEFHPLADGQTVALSDGGSGQVWSEYVHAAAGVDVLTRYADDPLAGSGLLAGRPAVTRRRYGSGAAWYVSTRLDDAAYARLLLDALGADAGAHAAVGVEVVRRHGTDTSWCFILNHTDGEQRVGVCGLDLVSGTAIDGEMRIPAGGYAVVREGAA